MTSGVTNLSEGSEARRARIWDFLRSSIGAKTIMAVTGLILWLFLIAHIGGNLQMFAGRDAFNSYAAFLQASRTLVWTERAVIVGAILIHALAAIRVSRLNRAARPVRYEGRATETSTLMSRTMMISGAVVLAFFVYHILHFTAHAVGGATFVPEVMEGGKTRPDAFLMVYSAFKTPAIVAVYVIGQTLLFAHLLHGSSSLFQTLGLHRIFRAPRAKLAFRGVVAAIYAGAIAVPLAIYFTWPAL